jgi:hypothetical protein
MRIFTLVVFALALAACKQPEPACVKMKTLCDTELKTCGELRDSLREKLGPEAVEKFDGCYLRASTCPEASGCLTGEAFKAVKEAGREFFEGLTNAQK